MNLLLIGEHPRGFSGNSNMMAALLERLDFSLFSKVSVFCCTQSGLPPDAFNKYEYHLIEGDRQNDPYGLSSMLNTIYGSDAHIIMFIGSDLWRFATIQEHLINLKKNKKFVWIALFPYDLTMVRNEWVNWMKPIDMPCVYSEYGFNKLKEFNANLRYFRPPLFNANKFHPFSQEIRTTKRSSIFKIIGDEKFLFGFFGANQLRKDPQRAIYSFFETKKSLPDISLYLHTEVNGGVFNLYSYLADKGNQHGDVFVKKQGLQCTTEALVDLYNSMDCLLNTSLQEGLSWTLLEAMLCGVPIIAANNTSQTELIENAGIGIECTDLSFIPIDIPDRSYVETRACNIQHLVDAMWLVRTNKEVRNQLIDKGLTTARKWLDGVSDINKLLDEAKTLRTTVKIKTKKKDILFIQHSSAGDVLMTTQCFRGIKERHKNSRLVYMTQKQYQDIVSENPYIDEVIDYDTDRIQEFSVVYDPHGTKILPGGWNNLDVTLYSMYPYFCEVEADDIFIKCIKPNEVPLPEKYIIVHTTGGDTQFRAYKHMDLVVDKINLPAVQIGGMLDIKVKNALDLRGKLSFRQTAWVMKNAVGAVVIDSFPSHLAGALGTPVVVLFGPAPARVTQPRGNKNKMVFLQPDMLKVCAPLSHCWGNPPDGKTICASPCINTISPLTIKNELNKLIGGSI